MLLKNNNMTQYIGTVVFFIEDKKLYFLVPYNSKKELEIPLRIKTEQETTKECALKSIPSSLKIKEEDIEYIESEEDDTKKKIQISISQRDKNGNQRTYFLAESKTKEGKKGHNPQEYLIIEIENEFAMSLLPKKTKDLLIEISDARIIRLE
jgi:hypothetical protein